MVNVYDGSVETQDFIRNDVTKPVFAWSPHSHPPRYFYLTTTSANIKPGHIVKRGTGAGGQATATECGTQEHMGFGIAEWDPTLVATCAVAYASGDLIPVIPFEMNRGVICRNLIVTDASANIPADTGYEADAGGAAEVSGEDIDTVYFRSLYYHVDGDPGPVLLVGYLCKEKMWADA